MNTLHIIFAHFQGDVILEQYIRIGFLKNRKLALFSVNVFSTQVQIKDTFSKGYRRCNFMYLVLGKYHPKRSNS